MKPIEIITSILAIYGALLSTLNYFIQSKSKKWRIAVTPSIGSLGKKEFVAFRAVNLGERTVSLNTFFIHLPPPELSRFKKFVRLLLIFPLFEKNKFSGFGFFGDYLVLKRDEKFPFELLPGKSFEIYLDKKLLLRHISIHAKGVVNFNAVFGDETGGFYRSLVQSIANLKKGTIEF